jgi:hypothetical protein
MPRKAPAEMALAKGFAFVNNGLSRREAGVCVRSRSAMGIALPRADAHARPEVNITVQPRRGFARDGAEREGIVRLFVTLDDCPKVLQEFAVGGRICRCGFVASRYVTTGRVCVDAESVWRCWRGRAGSDRGGE